MSASLRAGIASLPASAKGCFVFLGDMPRVPAAMAHHLLDALRANAAAAAIPVWNGQRGHPVLVTRALFPELDPLRGDSGARRLLDALGSKLVAVEAPDDGVLFDIDEVDQLAAG